MSALRPLVHASTGLVALSLGLLPPWLAVAGACMGVIVGFFVLPATGLERHLRRPGEPFFGGLRTYPLAVLALVVLLPAAEAAAAWAILAFGDAAAGWVGPRVPAPRILGHPKATWAGSAALLLAGTLGAWGAGASVEALGAWSGMVETGPAAGPARCVLAALAATAVDLAPIPPDDNLPLAAAAGATLAATGGML